jgi:hypothetical protein
MVLSHGRVASDSNDQIFEFNSSRHRWHSSQIEEECMLTKLFQLLLKAGEPRHCSHSGGRIDGIYPSSVAATIGLEEIV